MERLGALDARRSDGAEPAGGATLVLVHGFGLGAWMWERDQQLLAAAGHTSYAVDLPGHGADAGSDADLDSLVSGLSAAVAALDSPVLVGHGGGALVAQIVAERTNLKALVLINPLPSADVKFRPALSTAQALLSAVPTLVSGRVALSLDAASQTALAGLPEHERAAVHDRTTPWPGSLGRSLLRRPAVTPTGVPTLVLTGLLDQMVPSSTSRLVGDYHNAVTWRFDDVGHLPPLEPSGERVLRSMLAWLANPQPRKVLEIQAFQPAEGVGDQAREARVPRREGRSNSRFRRKNRQTEQDRRFKDDDASVA